MSSPSLSLKAPEYNAPVPPPFGLTGAGVVPAPRGNKSTSFKSAHHHHVAAATVAASDPSFSPSSSPKKGVSATDAPALSISSLASLTADEDYNYYGPGSLVPLAEKDRARHGMLRTMLRSQLERTRPNWPKHPNMHSTDRLLDESRNVARPKNPSATNILELKPGYVSYRQQQSLLSSSSSSSSRTLLKGLPIHDGLVMSGVRSYGDRDFLSEALLQDAGSAATGRVPSPSARNVALMKQREVMEPYLKIFAKPAGGEGRGGGGGVTFEEGKSPKGKEKRIYGGTKSNFLRNVAKGNTLKSPEPKGGTTPLESS